MGGSPDHSTTRVMAGFGPEVARADIAAGSGEPVRDCDVRAIEPTHSRGENGLLTSGHFVV